MEKDFSETGQTIEIEKRFFCYANLKLQMATSSGFSLTLEKMLKCILLRKCKR